MSPTARSIQACIRKGACKCARLPRRGRRLLPATAADCPIPQRFLRPAGDAATLDCGDLDRVSAARCDSYTPRRQVTQCLMLAALVTALRLCECRRWAAIAACSSGTSQGLG